MSDWPIRKISDVADFLNNKRIPLKSLDRQKRQGPYPYYGASGIVDYIDDYIFDGTFLLISEDGENLRTRNTPIAFKASGKFWVNNHAHILAEKEEGILDYLEYYFSKLDLTPYITGAVQPKLNKANLDRIEIPVPEKDERLEINKVLNSLSDKIELNRQTNQTLDQIAQAIFKSWFVDFEPVKAKVIAREKGGNELAQSLAAQAILCGAITLEQLQEMEPDYQGLEAQLHPLITERFPPQGLDYWTPESLQSVADQFPGEMVDAAQGSANVTGGRTPGVTSELGEIPEGWCVSDLKAVTTELRRGISPKYTEENGIQVVNQKCIRNHSINFELTRMNDPLKRKVDGRQVEVGDVLVNSTGVGTLGRLAPVRYLPDQVVFDSHVTVVRADTEVISKSFLIELMIVKESFIEASGAGSTGQTELRKEVLQDIKFVKPPMELGIRFDKIIEPMSVQIAELEQQQKVLAQLRDTFLPKLLSGEIALNASLSKEAIP